MASEQGNKLKGAKTFRKSVVGEDGVDTELLQAAVQQEFNQVCIRRCR
jgi:hypothetical protein